MLTQQRQPPPLTSKMKLSLFMHTHSVHSPWLPSYIDVTQNVLVILTMPEIFLDILYISSTLLLPQMMFLGDLGDAGNLGLPGCRLLPLEAGLQKMNGGII